MKLTIDVEPKEFAELLTELTYNMHKSYRDAEEKIGEMFINNIMKIEGKENKKTEEVPSGGYFH
jgi:hypothetical protein